MVRNVSPVFRCPSNPTSPTAPAYHFRSVSSLSSTNWIAHGLGAPVTVTAHVWHKKASNASYPSRKYPSTWSTVWINLLYFSICRRPITLTEPGLQIRDLSLRSTSVHIVSSLSSFLLVRISLMRSASSSASAPRRIVPEMGHVSTRIPFCGVVSQRTNISGDAPTKCSDSPKLMTNMYGEGLRSRNRAKISDGGAAQGS